MAALEVPTEAMSEVDVVPMFCPSMMGMALPQVTSPVLESACRIPTEAVELCTATVMSVPASRPRTGFCSVANSHANSGEFCRPLTACIMDSMPVNKRPMPIQIWPQSRLRGDLRNTNSTAPTATKIGARFDGLKSRVIRPPSSISASRRIWLVTVVPMLAPMITPMACESCMMPEFTRPTTITVVPELEWMSALIAAPSSTASHVDEVIFCRMLSILPPAHFSSPVPIMDMPYKNSARPPTRRIASKTVIPIGPHFSGGFPWPADSRFDRFSYISSYYSIPFIRKGRKCAAAFAANIFYCSTVTLTPAGIQTA